MVVRLEEALEEDKYLDSVLGSVVSLTVKKAERLERSKTAEFILGFLGVPESVPPEDGDWERLPPSALARRVLTAVSEK